MLKKSVFEWFESRINPYPEQELKLRLSDPQPKLWQFFWSCTQGLRFWLFLLVALTTVSSALAAYLFRILGDVVNWVAQTPSSQLWAVHGNTLLGMGALIVCIPLLTGLHALLRHQTLQGVFPMRLRWQFHRLLLRQSLGFYQEEWSGRLAAKVMQTALAVRDSVMTVGDVLVWVCVYFVSALVVVASFSQTLVWPFLIWLLGYGLVTYYFLPRLRATSSAQANVRALMTGRISDAYSNIALVKLFAHHHREATYVRESMQEFMHTVHKQMRLVTAYQVCHALLNAGLLLGLGVVSFVQGGDSIDIGALTASVALALRLEGLSQWVMWEVSGLFENIGTVQDGCQTLSQPVCVADKPEALAFNPQVAPMHHTGLTVAYSHVDFAYAGSGNLFTDFNLHIEAGEKVGIVGHSGAGKSSLLSLLLRFYDVQGGSVRIQGQDVRELTQSSLRRHIGVVTQDTALFHRSVRENLLYGRPEADDSALKSALQAANCDSFVWGLSDQQGRQGLDALVGERGVKLSGGQRQRLALARVLLKDAPVLVLDEATSALDSETEAVIQVSLAKLMQGKTVIAIAHRLSTIAQMDRLVVLDKGRIVESGPHTELLQRQGLYANLWQHQSGAFLVNDGGDTQSKPALGA